MTVTRDSNRSPLPEAGQFYVTAAGFETELLFLDKIELPEFCSGILLESPAGRKRLRDYCQQFISLATRHQCGLVLGTPTWRLNPDWAEKLGFNAIEQRRLHYAAVQLLEDLRYNGPVPAEQFVISGNIGPRFDGYMVANVMSPAEAADYHSQQIRLLGEAGVDCIAALTMTTSNEAAGVALAAQQAEIPVIISFTVETDGRMPSGETLGEAIQSVDEAAPGAVAYYGINCAHPTHFRNELEKGAGWRARIGALWANASTMSHAELDNCTELDSGDPDDLAERYRQLKALLPGLRVFGGCCGTDIRHVSRICETCCE
ncbi:homocysteine S-methyltransferase family protein [Rubinisphaera brasiliensis]|uniref:Homocysteine S-methyltransferase n=1 Tax=Rubinisphaera brasiliensis (strain ATCC 49424 / DSM 5305 / JCM 21570 / IAM 15109 / NBRC 103401 / IFAM 1448) TaxID=756272 RepID=F0SRN2_RUBBR|nr:homocysteine S-methyltransferase family protein [Rubinisphaera brasiliensis]ADY59155.1 homocysteine S-methyltransferase [Rubinisphaera brasiliensis DSM 5305]